MYLVFFLFFKLQPLIKKYCNDRPVKNITCIYGLLNSVEKNLESQMHVHNNLICARPQKTQTTT